MSYRVRIETPRGHTLRSNETFESKEAAQKYIDEKKKEPGWTSSTYNIVDA